MRKVTLTFGLLAGAVISVFLVIGMAIWEKARNIVASELIGYATMVIALSMIFFGIKSYRDNYQKGAINFWKGFQVGLLIALIASLMYAIPGRLTCRLAPPVRRPFLIIMPNA